jgi:hypothetical protein
MRKPPKRWVLSIVSICAILVGIGIILHLEPFAPRYQGRTENQWLDFWAAGGRSEGTDVRKAFGVNALPTLVKTTQKPFWFDQASQCAHGFKIDFVKRLFRKSVDRAIFRISFAQGWIHGLLRDSPDLLEHLLANNPDDKFVVEIFRYMETTYRPDLLQHYASNPDPQVRDRARRLFKQYKNWDDATYRRWLVSQTNGIVTTNWN